MKIGGLTKRQIRRLASLNRQLARAREREWEDDEKIILAEIEAIIGTAIIGTLVPS
jgi:hypothetical protein